MLFFLYGTLIDAADTPAARWLRPHLRSARAASIPGRLSAIPAPEGWYPALTAANASQRVRGTCCDLALTRADIACLDRYEGRDYIRATGRARVDGGLVVVQHYRWRGALPIDAQPIADGDFLAWLRCHGRHAYASRNREFAHPGNLAVSSVPPGTKSL